METLDGSSWDVVLVGTGIQQALLALALSRSNKKILHIDRNDYYGGAEAAFSLQEAESWVVKPNQPPDENSQFRNASFHRQEEDSNNPDEPKLSFSRAYSLSLAPHLIYSKSALLRLLVSSKAFQQLEFLAVGSFWVYKSPSAPSPEGVADAGEGSSSSSLLRVPSSREDVFADSTLDLNARRKLMKFLRFIAKFEEEPDIWQPHASKPFSDFLQQQFGISRAHQDPLLALTLSPNTPSETTTELALTQIATHLRSIGVFGRGFGAVMPKWGGLSEIAQVGCRACAVGGGVYVLDKGLDSVDLKESDIETKAETPCALEVKLNGGDTVLAQWLVGSSPDLASSDQNPYKANDLTTSMPGGVSRSISVVSSSLTSLFPSNAEGSPAPAAAVVFFPSGSLRNTDSPNKPEDHAPVYIQVHSSDTGECPAGQSVLYASTAAIGPTAADLLTKATTKLIDAVREDPKPIVLWKMQYEQSSDPHSSQPDDQPPSAGAEHIIHFPSLPLSLSFDDEVIETAREAWQKIMGDELAEAPFMVFEDREAMANLDEDDDDSE